VSSPSYKQETKHSSLFSNSFSDGGKKFHNIVTSSMSSPSTPTGPSCILSGRTISPTLPTCLMEEVGTSPFSLITLFQFPYLLSLFLSLSLLSLLSLSSLLCFLFLSSLLSLSLSFPTSSHSSLHTFSLSSFPTSFLSSLHASSLPRLCVFPYILLLSFSISVFSLSYFFAVSSV
jgi:hypothetical protein